jgi:hypothetical protein
MCRRSVLISAENVLIQNGFRWEFFSRQTKFVASPTNHGKVRRFISQSRKSSEQLISKQSTGRPEFK